MRIEGQVRRMPRTEFERAINASDLQEWIMETFPDWCEGDVRLIYDHIDDMPSAQPETAKRIVGKSRDGMTLWYQCDMCNEPVDVQDDFCRGCGRRLTDE